MQSGFGMVWVGCSALNFSLSLFQCWFPFQSYLEPLIPSFSLSILPGTTHFQLFPFQSHLGPLIPSFFPLNSFKLLVHPFPTTCTLPVPHSLFQSAFFFTLISVWHFTFLVLYLNTGNQTGNSHSSKDFFSSDLLNFK